MATTSFKQVKNNAKGTVVSGELNNSTNPVTFNLGTGEGALFPATASGSFYVTVWDSSTYPDPGDDSNMEIMLVTARSTDALTATRAQQGTSAVAHAGTPSCGLLVTASNVSDLNTAVNTLETALAPGTIMMYGGASAPTGWLMCDGSAVSRTTYSDLFGVISTTFGVGNGSTTFNVPDMRDRVPIGAGTTYSRNDSGGATTANLYHRHTTGDFTLTSTYIPSHYHSVSPPLNYTSSDGDHTHTLYKVWVFAAGGGSGLNDTVGGTGVTAMASAGSHQHTISYGSFNSGSTGSGSAHNHGNTGYTLSSSQSIMNPYRGVYFIIKT